MDAVLEQPLAFPRRLPPLVWWAIGGCVAVVLQLANGATLEFSALTGLFAFLTGLTVEACGGLKTLFGLCTLMFAVQHVLYSQLAKFVLQQPPEQRLQVPITTMAVYCVGMASFASGAYLSRYFRIARGASIFPALTDPSFLKNFAIGATIFAALRSGIVTIFNYDTSTSGLNTAGLVGPLRVLMFLDGLAVASGTAATIVLSGGRKSIGWLNVLPIAVPVLAGFLGAYRNGVGTAALAYLIAAWAYGYRFKVANFITLGACAYVFFFILSPYSIAARSQARTPDFYKNLQRQIYILGDVITNPGKYHEDTATAEDKVPTVMKLARYYPFPNKNLERFSMIRNADAIIAATVFRGTMEWRTIIPGFEMLPPSFLYDDKPVLGTANLLAHRAPGLVTNDDIVTQITIGEFADSFSSFGWLGIAVIPALVMLLYQMLYGFVVKLNLKNNCIAISLVPTFAVAFSEGTLSVQIITIVQGAIVAAAGIAVPYFTIRLLDATHITRRRMREADIAKLEAVA